MNQSLVDITAIRHSEKSNILPKEFQVITPILKSYDSTVLINPDISAMTQEDSDYKENYSLTSLNSELDTFITRNRFTPNEQSIETLDPAANENDHRITLLARKYATKNMAPEDTARLDILTERLRNTMPSITEGELTILEGLNNKLSDLLNLNNQLQEKYK